jgi:hypothetical protein
VTAVRAVWVIVMAPIAVIGALVTVVGIGLLFVATFGKVSVKRRAN